MMDGRTSPALAIGQAVVVLELVHPAFAGIGSLAAGVPFPSSSAKCHYRYLRADARRLADGRSLVTYCEVSGPADGDAMAVETAAAR